MFTFKGVERLEILVSTGSVSKRVEHPTPVYKTMVQSPTMVVAQTLVLNPYSMKVRGCTFWWEGSTPIFLHKLLIPRSVILDSLPFSLRSTLTSLCTLRLVRLRILGTFSNVKCDFCYIVIIWRNSSLHNIIPGINYINQPDEHLLYSLFLSYSSDQPP